MASIIIDETTIYYAYVIDRATIGYFLLTQLMTPFVDTNANLILDLLESESPPQSKSKKPLKVTPSLSFEQGCYFVSK
jgi:hypothetical protein